MVNVSAFSVELKVGTSIEDYRLPVVTGGADPQEGGGIARAWIEDPKVYPGIPMPNDGAGCLREQWLLQAAVLLKFWGFCC